MFARKLTTLLKPNSMARFSLLMEQQVIPMLRNQNGFQDVLTLSAPGQDAVTTISLWDSALNAEIYSRATYYEVLKRLAALLEGTPKVDTYQVLNSTFHKIAAVAVT
jgi:heme-degrading monooxygenase HmoA